MFRLAALGWAIFRRLGSGRFSFCGPGLNSRCRYIFGLRVFYGLRRRGFLIACSRRLFLDGGFFSCVRRRGCASRLATYRFLLLNKFLALKRKDDLSGHRDTDRHTASRWRILFCNRVGWSLSRTFSANRLGDCRAARYQQGCSKQTAKNG